jgi:alanine racemase
VFRHIRPVWAEINLNNLAYNVSEIRKISKSKDIIGVIKADGYGHGALDIAPILLESGITRLAVAVLDEAVELRRGGIKCPIMILGYTPTIFADSLLKYNIEQTVYSYEFALELSKIAEKDNKKIKIHIAIDTGMGRIGFLCDDNGLDAVYKISKLPNIIIEGLFSHFSTADEEDKTYTNYQIKRFNWFYHKLIEQNVHINIRHIANSAAIIDLPQCHFEAVRPGIILYGYYPSDKVIKNKINLKPVMSLKTSIVHIKELDSGEYISYGRRYKTARKSVIATLPVGYADGYTRLLFDRAKVIINGKFAPVIGSICMDQCMVDVTDMENINVGDEVVLMGQVGETKFDADDIAELLGTINYEVICMISKRVPRVYIKDGEVVKVRNYV